MLRVQLKLDDDNTVHFASPFLPNSGLCIEQCVDIEAAKKAIFNHVKTKTGQDVEFEEVKEISNFIFGIHH
jgi:hypothetical protein